MNRKEFLTNSLKNSSKIIKLIFYFFIFFYLLYFLKNVAIEKNSIERMTINLILVILGILVIFGFIRYFIENIWNSFPENVKSFLNKLNIILEYISIPILIYISYLTWQSNKLIVIIFGIIFISQYFNKKQTKQT
jgi:glucan phosphoethanolaminetransferase (alkaline phosphatase superfamily)